MLPVCEDKRNEVLQCYHSNPDRPLLCNQQVEAFTCCVERARQVGLWPPSSEVSLSLSLFTETAASQIETSNFHV